MPKKKEIRMTKPELDNDGVIISYIPQMRDGDDGQDYWTEIPCNPPPMQGNECAAGFNEECEEHEGEKVIKCVWQGTK